MLELNQNGNWYSIYVEYDGYGDTFKAHGKKELNELITDLIHDCKIDEQHGLVGELEKMYIQ
ncbi:hypothetical protein V7128_01985 [Neobacillus vireti]|uniref:hypothetical protein n=1 Tax=Neobacillus vireti TaxID=220686 RepID=UPI002FFE9168